MAPQRVEVYTNQITWLDRFDDHAGLEALLARLQRVENLDTATGEEQRRQYLAGQHDERSLRAGHTQLRRLELIGERLGSGATPATRAALSLLLANAHDTLATYEAPREHIRRRVALLQQAHELFPELAANRYLPSSLTELALHEAADECPELAARMQRDWRAQGTVALLHEVLVSGDAAALAALRKRPELAQAAQQRLALIDGGDDPGTPDWVLAALVNDGKLAEAARAAWAASDLKARTKIGLLLAPDGARAMARLIERGPKPY
jgi:hypothetical protein